MRIVDYVKKPWMIPIALQSRGVGFLVPDILYLRSMYYSVFNKNLNIYNPMTFNEKLQWLKLYDRNPIYTTMVDKYAVKKYVANIIGEEYIIPTLGVWDKFADIDFLSLPKQFVLKCTHDSGGVVICKDKKTFDIANARTKINESLKRDYYLNGREWPYKKVPHKIIAEKYMVKSGEEELTDYKIFCFNGQPKMTLVCTNRYSETGLCEDFFDNNWVHLPMKRSNHSNLGKNIVRPENHNLMMQFSQKLSQGTCFLRVDFYEIDGKVYFGEMTFFPASGFESFYPMDWDQKLGEMIKLPL